MWQLGRSAIAVGRRRIPAGARSRHVALPLRPPTRQFCDGLSLGAPPPRRPRPKKQSGPSGTQVSLVLFAGGVGAYAVSSDVREVADEFAGQCGERFEDFNDTSREFFERIGDKICAKKQDEPWLLDLATMKYPETIPTLVLDLDKVILHLEHDSMRGWHVVKRPHADQFFREIQHYYEVVIFSDDVFPVALDIANKWNLPVTGVLHRDFCRKKRSHYIKDLSKLGRKLDRMLIIDHDPEAYQLQPANGLAIKAFNGDPDDSELADLLDFLKAAAQSTGDIRQFVEKHGGGDEDLGRRYLLYKQDQDKLVEQRRSVGRAFASGGSGFPRQPASGFGGPGMGAFPR